MTTATETMPKSGLGEHVDRHIARLVAAAPPLSPEQRAKLGALLRGSAAKVRT